MVLTTGCATSDAWRTPMLDLFYLAIGVVGFLALWGIVKACERV